MELVPPSSKNDQLPWIGSHAPTASSGVSLKSPWKYFSKVGLELARICTVPIFDCLAWNSCTIRSFSQTWPHPAASRVSKRSEEDSPLSYLLRNSLLPSKYALPVSTLSDLQLLIHTAVHLCRVAHLARQTPWIFSPQRSPKLLKTLDPTCTYRCIPRATPVGSA